MSAIHSKENASQHLFWFSESESYLQFLTLVKMSLWFWKKKYFIWCLKMMGNLGKITHELAERDFERICICIMCIQGVLLILRFSS